MKSQKKRQWLKRHDSLGSSDILMQFVPRSRCSDCRGSTPRGRHTCMSWVWGCLVPASWPEIIHSTRRLTLFPLQLCNELYFNKHMQIPLSNSSLCMTSEHQRHLAAMHRTAARVVIKAGTTVHIHLSLLDDPSSDLPLSSDGCGMTLPLRGTAVSWLFSEMTPLYLIDCFINNVVVGCNCLQLYCSWATRLKLPMRFPVCVQYLNLPSHLCGTNILVFALKSTSDPVFLGRNTDGNLSNEGTRSCAGSFRRSNTRHYFFFPSIHHLSVSQWWLVVGKQNNPQKHSHLSLAHFAQLLI